MNNIDYADYFVKSKFMNTRDFIFHRVLKLLNGQPARILEIGTMRSTPPDHHERFSDGWSTMWWCEYIKLHGGELVSVDIEDDHIEIAKEITRQYRDRNSVYFETTDGTDFLRKDSGYDLIYLDGSDDPDEMAAQFDLCPIGSIVLCDDFQIKGRTLNKRGIPKIKYVHEVSRHEMCLFYDGCEDKEIIVPERHLIQQKYQEYYYVDRYKQHDGLLKEHRDLYE